MSTLGCCCERRDGRVRRRKVAHEIVTRIFGGENIELRRRDRDDRQRCASRRDRILQLTCMRIGPSSPRKMRDGRSVTESVDRGPPNTGGDPRSTRHGSELLAGGGEWVPHPRARRAGDPGWLHGDVAAEPRERGQHLSAIPGSSGPLWGPSSRDLHDGWPVFGPRSPGRSWARPRGWSEVGLLEHCSRALSKGERFVGESNPSAPPQGYLEEETYFDVSTIRAARDAASRVSDRNGRPERPRGAAFGPEGRARTAGAISARRMPGARGAALAMDPADEPLSELLTGRGPGPLRAERRASGDETPSTGRDVMIDDVSGLARSRGPGTEVEPGCSS